MWSIHDLGGFAQTLMLSAASRKIDSIIAYELVKYPDNVRPYLGISEDELLVSGIALGYRTTAEINNLATSRVPVEDILIIKD